MKFSASFASLVLAFASTGKAAPYSARSSDLSLVQQLMLAPLAAMRYDLLPNNEDFKFNMNPEPVPEGRGGNLKAANRNTFPALVGSGAGMAVGVLKPCGINTFHVHPRSSELQLLIQGAITTEMVPENGVNDSQGKRRVIRNDLSKFDLTVFPLGSVHHQFNPNCEDAIFVASFASEDFGTGQVVDEVLSMDTNAIVDTFGATISGADVQRFREKLPASVVQGVEVCMNKCYGK